MQKIYPLLKLTYPALLGAAGAIVAMVSPALHVAFCNPAIGLLP